MNGIWIRSECGKGLLFTHNLSVLDSKGEEKMTYALGVDDPVEAGRFMILATYESEEAAMRQLDDIQRHMRQGVMHGAVNKDDFGDMDFDLRPYVYDLRERKIKEGDQ